MRSLASRHLFLGRAQPWQCPATTRALFPLVLLLVAMDPDVAAQGTWSPGGQLVEARSAHTSTLLPNGKVLVAGGNIGSITLSSAEIYDPSSNTWTATGSMATARYVDTATLLPSGKVLVIGGSATVLGAPGPAFSTCELYDPATGTWTTSGSLTEARAYHAATLLPNGKVLVAGGQQPTSGSLEASPSLPLRADLGG